MQSYMMSDVMHHLFHCLVVHNCGEDHHDKCNELLDYQYVSETAGRVAVAGIAMYFCAKWARTPAESLHVMISLPTYDIIALDMISWLFPIFHDIMLYMISYVTYDIIVLL